jgi:hypothetical protein
MLIVSGMVSKHFTPREAAGKGQGNAGVAAGGFDDCFTGSEEALLLGIPHHGGADTALHRIGRVAPLNFDQDGGPAARTNAIEAHQRGVADALGIVCIYSGIFNSHFYSFDKRKGPQVHPEGLAQYVS